MDMVDSDRCCWTLRPRALLWVLMGGGQPALAVRGAGQLGVGWAERPSTKPGWEGWEPVTIHGEEAWL